MSHHYLRVLCWACSCSWTLLNLYHLKWTPVSILYQALLLLLKCSYTLNNKWKASGHNKANILMKNLSGSQPGRSWDLAILVNSLVRSHIHLFSLGLMILGKTLELCSLMGAITNRRNGWSGPGRGPFAEIMEASRENSLQKGYQLDRACPQSVGGKL